VFAEVYDTAEITKIANLRPRGKRPVTPGSTITLEGTITKIEDGRFAHLSNAIVR